MMTFETHSHPWGPAIDAMYDRIRQTLADPAEGFPHFADPATGAWTRTPTGDWTGGFWVGQLWLAAAATRDRDLQRAAVEWSGRLRQRLPSETVFRGFLFWYGAGIGDLLLGDDDARELSFEGARALAGLYNQTARLIPLGPDAEEASDVGRSETNIDGVPGTVPLLAHAAAQSDADADGLRDLARSHAHRHVDLLVRPDGSVVQSASLDPDDGTAVRRYTHKGARDDSTWARAQAWGLLGLSQSAHWLSSDFAEPAVRVGDWWVANLPADGVAYWDFDAPGTIRDTSATAIAAAALLKLAQTAPARAARYRHTAELMVEALVDRHLTPLDAGDGRPPGMLLDGCYNQRIGLAPRNELIWGSYFLLEALLGLSGTIDTAAL